jgi:hypothetical protein
MGLGFLQESRECYRVSTQCEVGSLQTKREPLLEPHMQESLP